jgi:hypothetical protein
MKTGVEDANRLLIYPEVLSILLFHEPILDVSVLPLDVFFLSFWLPG